MDSNPSPPLLQPPSRALLPFPDDKNDSFTSKSDPFNGADLFSNGVRGSIAERRAAKFGFKAERISTPRFRTTSPLNSPAASGVRSPCITIPPGISPTALLDSPVLLSNAQPSPTTGTFPFPHFNYGGSTRLSTADPAYGDDAGNSSDTFRFKPNTGSFVGFATVCNQGPGDSADFQAVDFEFPVDLAKEARPENNTSDSTTDLKILNSINGYANRNDMQNQTCRQIEPAPGEYIDAHYPLRQEKGTFPAIGMGINSDDEYNWRKYGQKQVKGSEYPRSYYKCTSPNCEVKKKIERSYDGQITEIIYKGTHNHPKPQPSRRSLVGSASSYNKMPEMDENSDHSLKGEVGSVWKLDGLERTSSASVITEVSTAQGKSMGMFDSAGTPDLSSTLDGATEGSISLGADVDADADAEESESKRRKIDDCLVETSLTSRAIREPRVVVQIESEIDILDDGYRWRKYGQKVVKGNPNPRSYYKCTSAGCTVRKHVERASHNLKFVITTYEGKHNHGVPPARNSTNGNFSHVSNHPQPALTLPRNTNGQKPQKLIQDYASGYDRKPLVSNGYLTPVLPGNFSNEMNVGTPSNYTLKFPTFQHTMPYGSCVLNRSAIQQSGSIAALVPSFAFSLPPSLHASANLSLAGADFGYNAKAIGQDQPFIAGQQFVRPKQEQRDENIYDAAPPTVDHINASPSSSIYHQMMGNFR